MVSLHKTNEKSGIFPTYGKTPSLLKGVYHTRFSGSDSCGFVQLLCKTGLFTIGSVLMNNAFGRSLVDYCGSRGQLHVGVLRISFNSGVKLTDGSTHTALDNTVLKILLLADLNAFLGGLDIRQLGSPPLRILKRHRVI